LTLRLNLLILGAGGMIGRMLLQRTVRVGWLAGKAIFGAHLVDIGGPDPGVSPFPVAGEAFDISAS
jgi:hypothetical protein